VDGLKAIGTSAFQLTAAEATIQGLLVAPRAEGHVRVDLSGTKTAGPSDLTFTQVSSRGVDGGITIRLSRK